MQHFKNFFSTIINSPVPDNHMNPTQTSPAAPTVAELLANLFKNTEENAMIPQTPPVPSTDIIARVYAHAEVPKELHYLFIRKSVPIDDQTPQILEFINQYNQKQDSMSYYLEPYCAPTDDTDNVLCTHEIAFNSHIMLLKQMDKDFEDELRIMVTAARRNKHDEAIRKRFQLRYDNLYGSDDDQDDWFRLSRGNYRPASTSSFIRSTKKEQRTSIPMNDILGLTDISEAEEVRLTSPPPFPPGNIMRSSIPLNQHKSFENKPRPDTPIPEVPKITAKSAEPSKIANPYDFRNFTNYYQPYVPPKPVPTAYTVDAKAETLFTHFSEMKLMLEQTNQRNEILTQTVLCLATFIKEHLDPENKLIFPFADLQSEADGDHIAQDTLINEITETPASDETKDKTRDEARDEIWTFGNNPYRSPKTRMTRKDKKMGRTTSNHHNRRVFPNEFKQTDAYYRIIDHLEYMDTLGIAETSFEGSVYSRMQNYWISNANLIFQDDGELIDLSDDESQPDSFSNGDIDSRSTDGSFIYLSDSDSGSDVDDERDEREEQELEELRANYDCSYPMGAVPPQYAEHQIRNLTYQQTSTVQPLKLALDLDRDALDCDVLHMNNPKHQQTSTVQPLKLASDLNWNDLDLEDNNPMQQQADTFNSEPSHDEMVAMMLAMMEEESAQEAATQAAAQQKTTFSYSRTDELFLEKAQQLFHMVCVAPQGNLSNSHIERILELQDYIRAYISKIGDFKWRQLANSYYANTPDHLQKGNEFYQRVNDAIEIDKPETHHDEQTCQFRDHFMGSCEVSTIGFVVPSDSEETKIIKETGHFVMCVIGNVCKMISYTTYKELVAAREKKRSTVTVRADVTNPMDKKSMFGEIPQF